MRFELHGRASTAELVEVAAAFGEPAVERHELDLPNTTIVAAPAVYATRTIWRTPPDG